MQNEEQTNMEFGIPEKIDSKWYVPLNRNNLIAVLAGGVIPPHQCYTDYEDDLQQYCDDGVLLISNGTSQEILESEELTGASGYTVLAEINVDGYPKTKLRAINNKGNGCKASITAPVRNTTVISFPGIIPTTRITAIHFKSDIDRKNFVVRGFDNVPTEVIPLTVSERLFNYDVPESVIEGIKNFKGDSLDGSTEALRSLYKQSDSFAGSAVLLSSTFPPKNSWLNLLKNTLTSKNPCRLPDVDIGGIITDKLELSIFNTAYSILIKMDPEEGWQAKKVLSDIYSTVDRDALPEREKIQLDKWQSTCSEILDNKRNITPLTDNKMKVGRALLLLLLRPDPDEVVGSAHSSLEPGSEVLSLAAILAGARYGLEALSNDNKSFPLRYNLFSNLKADLLNKNWNDSFLKKHSDSPHVEINEQAWGVMGQSFRVLVNDELLSEKKDEGSLELRTALNKAEAAGVKLKYERDQHRLCYRYEFKNGRTQIVYVSVGEENENNDKTIRFWSPCLDVSDAKGKKLFNAAMSKTLLEMNCEMHIYCRFAFCKKEKAILVIHDQILDTMDQRELCAGLQHVAVTADNFENGIGLDAY